MKQVKKMMMIAIAIFMGTAMTSCLDSDNNGTTYDYGSMMNVTDDIISYSLISDEGYTFDLVNRPAILEHIQRGYFFVKLQEGDVFDLDKKRYSNVTLVETGLAAVVDRFNSSPDTLKSFKINELSNPFYGGGYINLEVAVNFANAKDVRFDMVAEKAEENILYAKMNYSKGGGDNAYNSGKGFYAYRIPSLVELQGLLDLQKEGGTLVPDSNDSIQVQVIADGVNGEIKPKIFKVHIRQY